MEDNIEYQTVRVTFHLVLRDGNADWIQETIAESLDSDEAILDYIIESY